MDEQSAIAEPDDIDIAIEDRAILMSKRVVPYKVYIRKIVETATVSEINRWDVVRLDAMDAFKAVPAARRNRFLPWLVFILGVSVLYYFLIPAIIN